MNSRQSLNELGLKPKKSFGQNFMMDQRINHMIKDTVASLAKDPIVLEIGVGAGSLTSHLVACARLVHGVERDRDLIPLLKQKFCSELEEKKFILHEEDGAKFDLSQVFTEERGILVGNLPYHLTSSIVLLTIKNYHRLFGSVFLVQKEVADRLLANHNCKQYGFLTVVLQLAFKVSRVCNVDRKAFWPIPKVDSAVIKLTFKDSGISEVKDLDDFISFVRRIFQQRRKKLSTILTKDITKNQISSLAIDPNLRPENLSPQQFLKLYQGYLSCQKDQR